VPVKEDRVQLAKTVTLGCCLLVAIGSGLWAQGYPPGATTASPPAPAPAAPAPAAPAAPTVSADAKLIVFELGIGGGLKLGSNSGRVGRIFGLDLTLTDTLTGGLVDVVTGTTDYTMVKLAYRLFPAVGFSVFVGSDATPSTAAGVGVFYSVVKSKPDSSLATGLQLHLDYFAAVAGGFGKGDIVLGIVSYIGL
jgi:hypothetical protein